MHPPLPLGLSRYHCSGISLVQGDIIKALLHILMDTEDQLRIPQKPRPTKKIRVSLWTRYLPHLMCRHDLGSKPWSVRLEWMRLRHPWLMLNPRASNPTDQCLRALRRSRKSYDLPFNITWSLAAPISENIFLCSPPSGYGSNVIISEDKSIGIALQPRPLVNNIQYLQFNGYRIAEIPISRRERSSTT